MSQIYIIRHAKSLANVQRIYGTDYPLSEEGILQTKARSDAIYRFTRPDMVICSGLTRAFQTARILFPQQEKITSDSAFNEINFGFLEAAVINSKIDAEISNNVKILEEKYGGDDMDARAENALDEIQALEYLHPDKTIVIVSHGTLIECMVSRIRYDAVKNGAIWKKDSERLENVDVLDWTSFKKHPKKTLKAYIYRFSDWDVGA